MIAILMDKKLRTMTNILVFNLALSDLLISGIVDQFTGIGNLHAKESIILYLVLKSDFFDRHYCW